MHQFTIEVDETVVSLENAAAAVGIAAAALSHALSKSEQLQAGVDSVREAFTYMRANIPGYDHVFDAAYEMIGHASPAAAPASEG